MPTGTGGHSQPHTIPPDLSLQPSDLDAHWYHKMGVQTVCPSCGVIEPYRHGAFIGTVAWDAGYLRLSCFDPWCRDHMPAELSTETLVRIDPGVPATAPYQSFPRARGWARIRPETPSEIDAAMLSSRHFRAARRNKRREYKLDKAAMKRIADEEERYTPDPDAPSKARAEAAGKPPAGIIEIVKPLASPERRAYLESLTIQQLDILAYPEARKYLKHRGRRQR